MAEQYPTNVTLNALSGSTDGQQEVAYPTLAESPYYTSFYKMLYRLLDVARRAGDLRVFKDSANTFGVRGGKLVVGDTTIDYAEVAGQSLTNDAMNYIYLTAVGTLTVNTTGLPDPSTTPHLPLATIAVGSASAAQIDDEYDFVDLVDYRGRAMFAALTALTAANANTLVGGASADALHLHEMLIIIPVEDLAADGDIAARPIFVHPRVAMLVSAGILTKGAPAGVDDANTAVITLKDDAGNTIVTKTYDTATPPPTSDYEDLGTLDVTHKILTAAEHITLDVTQGTTADLPAMDVVLRYLVADA